MNDRLLDAVATVVSMVRGAYTWDEALSYAIVQFDLDEFQTEDLPRLARGRFTVQQYDKLMEQIQ